MNLVPAGLEDDRLLRAKGTDESAQLRPDNDFDDGSIINSRERQFNSTPLQSKRIQIRTTLAPFRRKDSNDNNRMVPAFIFEKKSFVVENCIDNFLSMACCPEYIEAFKTQKIRINQLLRMTESDFEKLGIEKLGDRRRLIDFIKEFHRKPWSNVAIEPFSNIVEAVRLIANLHAELSSMESNLMHFRRSLMSDDRINIVPVDDSNVKFNCEKLKSEMEFCQLAVDNLSKELKRTFEFIANAMLDNSIEEQNNDAKIHGKFYKASAVIALSSAVVILMAFLGGKFLVIR